jgi:pimeloyl-ACP methyl ester carboxylesterase
MNTELAFLYAILKFCCGAVLFLAAALNNSRATAQSQTSHSPEHNSPAIKTGYAPVNGLQLYYEIRGTGQPLVLLHGGGSSINTSFGQVLAVLAKTRMVVAFDQQGHGRTPDVDRPFSFQQSADDAVALLHYLKIDKADFLGYSNGGHIAIQIALSHPESVRRLIIESAMVSREGSDASFWDSFHSAKLDTMPTELRQAYLAEAPHPENLQSFFDKSVQRMLNFKGWSPDEIRSIQATTLVLLGDRDIVRPEHAVEMFRLLPHAQLAILPNTDHMQIVNRAGWTVPLVEAFLNAPAS